MAQKPQTSKRLGDTKSTVLQKPAAEKNSCLKALVVTMVGVIFLSGGVVLAVFDLGAINEEPIVGQLCLSVGFLTTTCGIVWIRIETEPRPEKKSDASENQPLVLVKQFHQSLENRHVLVDKADHREREDSHALFMKIPRWSCDQYPGTRYNPV